MLETETLWPTIYPSQPVISDEELEYLFMIHKEEIIWKTSQPKISFSDLIKTYAPEAITPARRGLKAQLKFLKQKIRDINLQQEEYYESRIVNIPWQERNEFQDESDREFDQMRAKVSSKIKTIMFNLSHLDELAGKTKPRVMGGVAEADVARAKEIPITNFIQVDKSGFTKCPFHNETSASFKVYKDQNSWWCYSCNSGGTIIDFIMRSNNLSFLDAVKFLLK